MGPKRINELHLSQEKRIYRAASPWGRHTTPGYDLEKKQRLWRFKELCRE